MEVLWGRGEVVGCVGLAVRRLVPRGLVWDGHLADPEFLAIAPLFLRLLELVLAVGEAGFLLGRPGRGGGQMTR